MLRMIMKMMRMRTMMKINMKIMIIMIVGEQNKT